MPRLFLLQLDLHYEKIRRFSMAKITINLLPAEFLIERLKDAKFAKIQAVGVGMILLVVFLSSMTVALRVLQSQRIKQAEDKLNTAKQDVVSLQDRQVSLVALKDRLSGIQKHLGALSPQAELFIFMNDIIPGSVSISGFNIDQSGNVSFSAVFPDISMLEQVIADLTNKDKNKNKNRIKEVSIENLNRGRDGLFRASFKIKSNEL